MLQKKITELDEIAVETIQNQTQTPPKKMMRDVIPCPKPTHVA